jgi:predicted nucleic acid-binding Zn ribbon protein
MSRRSAPPTCAICGADIPPRSRACPECGADERTGWDEQSIYDGLDLPEDADGDTPPPSSRRRRERLTWFWRIVGVGLLIVLGVWLVRG